MWIYREWGASNRFKRKAYAEGPHLRFMYSVSAKATCIEGSPVTQEDDSRWGLEMLGQEEQEFFLKHVNAK